MRIPTCVPGPSPQASITADHRGGEQGWVWVEVLRCRVCRPHPGVVMLELIVSHSSFLSPFCPVQFQFKGQTGGRHMTLGMLLNLLVPQFPPLKYRDNESTYFREFPGGPVVENLPANAGDTGSISGLERCPHVTGQPSLVPQLLTPCSRARWSNLQKLHARACALQQEKPPQ